MKAGVYISVGSNIDPEANVFTALGLLHREAPLVRISTFYITEPISRPEQPPFYNGVVEVETDLEPHPLKFSVLRRIEAELGRRRTDDRFAARCIDLDILLHRDRVIHAGGIDLPDPEISRRPFLAVPLSELAPDVVLPGSNRLIREVAAGFGEHGMKSLADYTKRLRDEWC
jgi:dihydroneopterin aldolase/2-amino-4-hydroxy-6-hydroxymethyldihydropteridine diphosphokinase